MIGNLLSLIKMAPFFLSCKATANGYQKNVRMTTLLSIVTIHRHKRTSFDKILVTNFGLVWERIMFIYMGFRLEIYSDNWHFKDSVKTRFGNPNMWHMNIFQF